MLSNDASVISVVCDVYWKLIRNIQGHFLAYGKDMVNVLTNESKQWTLTPNGWASLRYMQQIGMSVSNKANSFFFFCLSGGLISCILTDCVVLRLQIHVWTDADSWNIVSGPWSSKTLRLHQVCFHPLARLESAKKNHSELNRELKGVTVCLIKSTLGCIFCISDLLSTIVSISQEISR